MVNRFRVMLGQLRDVLAKEMLGARTLREVEPSPASKQLAAPLQSVLDSGEISGKVFEIPIFDLAPAQRIPLQRLPEGVKGAYLVELGSESFVVVRGEDDRPRWYHASAVIERAARVPDTFVETSWM